MKNESLKQALRERPLMGTFTTLRDPNAIGVLASAGFDFVLIDMEHFPLSNLQDLVNAAHARGIAAVARIADARRSTVQHALETGVDGILAPMIEDGAGARELVSHARYGPLGSRGFHRSTPAADFGTVPPEEMVVRANERVLVGAQIETPRGVENRREICAVEGLDLVFVGPGDLSQALGLPGQFDHPRVLEHAKEILESAAAAELVGGIYAGSDDLAVLARKQGATFIISGADIGFMRRAARETAEQRRALFKE